MITYTTEELKQRIIKRANSELGYLEKASNSQLDNKTANAGKNNWTKYARDLDQIGNIYNGAKNGYSWCDVFVDWLFIIEFGISIGNRMLYQPLYSLGAGVKYSANYYRNNDAFFLDPEIADQIFFRNTSGKLTHTGIVTGITQKHVYTIEGNTNSTSGVVNNGGSVAAKAYLRNSNMIAGYGRPNWELAKYQNEEGENESLFTYEQFCDYVEKYLSDLKKKPGSNWYKEGQEWAKNEKIIVGDENGNLMWASPVTREQLAQILFRLNNK